MDNKLVITILSSVMIWGAVALIALRVLAKSGLAIPADNKFMRYIYSDDKMLKGSFEPTAKEVAAVFGIALLFRAAVFVLSICPMFMLNNGEVSFNGIMSQYMKWDAQWYQSIAEGGYTNHTENGDYTTLAFFPIYPWIVRCMAVIFRDIRLSGIVTSSLLYAGACCYLYKLFALDYSKSTTVRAIVYLSIFPFAFFFGTIMTESTLLFTMSATLYYIRTHNWKMVGIFGALAALSRMVGILCAFPAAVEWLEEYKIFDKLKNGKIKEVWRLFYSKGLWIFLMLLGTAIYLYCNYRVTGDPFKFLEYQRKYWSHGSAYFASGINLVFSRMLSDDASTNFQLWIPSVFSIIFIFVCIIYGIRRNRNMYTAFAVTYFILNISFDWVISVPRYMSCAIPAFLFLADMSERHKWAGPIITAASAIGFGIYLSAWICYKQIF